MKNVGVRHYDIEDNASGEQHTGYNRIKAQKTVDESTARSYKISSKAPAEMRSVGIVVKIRELVERTYLPLLVSYYCGISESTRCGGERTPP